MMKDTLKNWRNCGWSATQQQHSKHETKRTAVLKTSKPVEFSRKITKMRSYRGEMAKTVAGVKLDNNTDSTKPERNQQQGRKIRGPS
jgi:chorismate mutase